jgi:hypothetical protein
MPYPPGNGVVDGTLSEKQETSMARYLDTRLPGAPPSPDLQTRMRTDPRIKAVLWSLAAACMALIVVAMVVTHVL